MNSSAKILIKPERACKLRELTLSVYSVRWSSWPAG